MIIEPEQPRVAVAIDALNQLPPEPPAPAGEKPPGETTPPPASPASEQSRLQQELQSTKDVVVKQAEELQKLKAELESVRRQLAEKESAASKAKPKTAPRKPAPTP
jgi:molecular chaperone GrpE (heat shock protein)